MCESLAKNERVHFKCSLSARFYFDYAHDASVDGFVVELQLVSPFNVVVVLAPFALLLLEFTLLIFPTWFCCFAPFSNPSMSVSIINFMVILYIPSTLSV